MVPKKHIILFTTFLFLLSCDVAEDPNIVFKNRAEGNWTLTIIGAQVLVDNGFKAAAPIQVVTINNGSFLVAGLNFSFQEVESTGSLAVYDVLSGLLPGFMGLGFGTGGDLVITEKKSSSLEGITPDSSDTVVFLER